MPNTTPKFDRLIAEIIEGNERRQAEPRIVEELSAAAINRMAIESASEMAS